jgi:hypothetical protein
MPENLLDDGTLDGDAISFFIHHVDNRRNWMRGVVTGNVMKFKWVRECHESEPGGEITMIGPVRSARHANAHDRCHVRTTC